MKKKDRKKAKILLQAVLDIFDNPKWDNIDYSDIRLSWGNILYGSVDEVLEDIESLLSKKPKEIVLEPNCKYELKYTGAYCSLGSILFADNEVKELIPEAISSCNWLFVNKIEMIKGFYRNIFYAKELEAYVAFDAEETDYIIKKVS